MCCTKNIFHSYQNFQRGVKKKKNLYINLTAILVLLWINVVIHKQITSADLHNLLQLEKNNRSTWLISGITLCGSRQQLNTNTLYSVSIITKKVLEKHFDIMSSLLISHLSHNTLLSPSPTIASRNPSQTYICGNGIDLVLCLVWRVLSLVLKRLFIINYENNLTKKKETNPESPQSFDSSAARKSFAAPVEKDISLKETT